jgi:hypothetical protein
MKKILFSTILILAFAATSYAIPATRTAVQLEQSEYTAAQEICHLAYYNYCSGWVWHFSGWGTPAKVGVCFDLNDCICCETCRDLGMTRFYWYRVTPYGYADMEVFCADDYCCPVGGPLAGYYHVWLDPSLATWWVYSDFSGVSLANCPNCRFILMGTFDGAHTDIFTDADPLNFDAGCSTPPLWNCTPHSYIYLDVHDYCAEFGSPAAFFMTDSRSDCPTYYGYVGYFADFLCWADITCTGPSATDQNSWSEIKALYR